MILLSTAFDNKIIVKIGLLKRHTYWYVSNDGTAEKCNYTAISNACV